MLEHYLGINSDEYHRNVKFGKWIVSNWDCWKKGKIWVWYITIPLVCSRSACIRVKILPSVTYSFEQEENKVFVIDRAVEHQYSIVELLKEYLFTTWIYVSFVCGKDGIPCQSQSKVIRIVVWKFATQLADCTNTLHFLDQGNWIEVGSRRYFVSQITDVSGVLLLDNIWYDKSFETFNFSIKHRMFVTETKHIFESENPKDQWYTDKWKIPVTEIWFSVLKVWYRFFWGPSISLYMNLWVWSEGASVLKKSMTSCFSMLEFYWGDNLWCRPGI